MSLILRPYQEDTITQARVLIRKGERSILIQSPTGSGKTVIVAKMLKNASARGHHAWFCVHRRELVRQSVLTLIESADIPVGVVAAGFPGDRRHLVQVCSIQTLRHRRQMLKRPSLIVWDECHHVAASTWATIFEEYPTAIHIGLTATPERLDGTGLGKWFKKLIIGPSVGWLIDAGYLSDYKLLAPRPPDLTGVHSVAGDYNRRELDAAMNRSTVTGDVLSHYLKHANGKRMVIFAWSIEASTKIAEQFRHAGIAAAHVDGKTHDTLRDLTMDQFRKGEVKVLCNVDLFGEGVDVPAMEAVALLRPTQSLTLYLQQIGRALRPSPGKEQAIILDHAGNCRRFGMPDDERRWSLEGRRKERPEPDAFPVRQCPMCFAVMAAGVEKCRHCGYVFVPVPREIERADGDLEETDESLARQERLREQSQARTLEDLVRLGQLRGYKKPEKWAQMIHAHREAKRAAREAERAMRDGLV